MAPDLVNSTRRQVTLTPTSVSFLYGVTAQRVAVLVAAAAIAVLSAYIVATPPATAYEPSLIEAFPLPFWVAFGVGLAALLVTFVGAGATGSSYWKHGFVLLATQYGLFFSLPLVRGYFLYGRGHSDSLFHLTAVKELVYSGLLSGRVFYPHEHFLFSELVLVGVPVESLVSLVPFVFALAFIGGIGLFVRELTGSPAGLPLGIAAGMPLVFSKFYTQLHPSVLSFFLFPLVLLMLERGRRTNAQRYVALATVYGLAMVFFHPITALLLVVLITSTFVFGHVYRFVTKTPVRTLRARLAFAILPATFIWYIGFPRTQENIREIVAAQGESAADKQADLLAGSVLNTEELVMRFVELYGAVFILFALAGVVCLVVLADLLRRRSDYAESYLATEFVIGAGIAATFIAVSLVANGPIRVSRYMILMAMVLTALLFVRVLSWPRGVTRTVGAVVLTLLVLSSALLGSFTVYDPNKHMTQSEHEGAFFLLEHSTGDHLIRSHSLTQKTQYFTTAGTDVKHDRTLMRVSGTGKQYPKFALAPQFGYDEYDRASVGIGAGYVATHEYDRAYLETSYFTDAQREALFLHDETTLERMSRDRTVQKVYSNGGFEGWLVRWTDEKPAAAAAPGADAGAQATTASGSGGAPVTDADTGADIRPVTAPVVAPA
ncbi:hypothetical protein [Salinigranum halophilum]|uniref:hypothetical protein n=1 Tax=Salinigranum halophilum TaxID=2565931 RepID=UPI0010A8D9CB|nr:hypothetical protein [Salinigranum halophilum]